MVLRVCRAVLGPADAEDAWSETFLAALKAYPGAARRTRTSRRGWSRSRTARPSTCGGPTRAPAGGRRRGAGPGVPDRAPGVARRPVGRAARAAAQAALAVAYHYLAGLPYREIAAITGGTADAARRAAADGIKALRATYPREEHAHETLDALAAYRRRGRRTAARATGRRTPSGRACSTSPTAPSTPRSARCCSPRPSAGWSGSAFERRGPRRGAGPARRHGQPADPAAPRRASTRPPASSTSTSPAGAPLRRAAGPAAGDRLPARGADHLPDIGYGRTESYAQVAPAAGSPKAVRAVGTACATNPLPVVVPCHRVVRSDGTFGRYAGGAETLQSA